MALNRGDLLDASDVSTFPWRYDGEGIALTLRSDYRRQHHDARLHLADPLVAGPLYGLPRAAELYVQLCGGDPEDERLWMALFRVYERAGDALGLGQLGAEASCSAVRAGYWRRRPRDGCNSAQLGASARSRR